MNKYLSALLALVLTLPTSLSGKELPFKSEETLDFSLMYKWGGIIKEVGTARVKLDSLSYDGHQVYHTDVRARTSDFFDSFYKIREHFQSWFRVSDIRPQKFIRDTQEGKYKAYNLYRYNWDRKVIDAEVNMNKPTSTKMEIPLRDGVYDLPTLIYYIRTLDMDAMKPGQRIPLTFAIDDEVCDVILVFRGKVPLKVRKINLASTNRFSCSVVGGELFEGDKDLQVWFTDDANRIPVAVMAPLRVGGVWMYLKGCSHLKYPFASAAK